jgi:hypothetical protein
MDPVSQSIVSLATATVHLIKSFSNASENGSHEEVNSEIHINTIAIKISYNKILNFGKLINRIPIIISND